MNASHRIIYTHGAGRLGNQVLRFAHWIAWALEHAGEVEVVNLAFWPYARDFEKWRAHPACVYPFRTSSADRIAQSSSRLLRPLKRNNRLQRVVQAAGRLRPGWQAIDLNVSREESLSLDGEFLARVQERTVTTCCGWEISNWALIEKHEESVRALFRPAAEHDVAAYDYVSSIRRSYDLVIGVQIRRTDYRDWHEGRFLFSAAQYAVWMKQLQAIHDGRRVAFLVTSEEVHDPGEFDGLPVFFAGGSANRNGPPIRSWAELSHCDFVVSPPSTFSATAAFIRDVPLLPLVEEGKTLNCDQILTGGLVAAARHPLLSLAVK